MENKYGFTEVLKHVNDMAHRIDLDKLVSKYEMTWKIKHYQKQNSLPEGVCQKQRDWQWLFKKKKISLRRYLWRERAFSNIYLFSTSILIAIAIVMIVRWQTFLDWLPLPHNIKLHLQEARCSGLSKFFENFYVNLCRERHGTEGSNVSGTSLEHSSSVEVCAQLYKTFGNVKSDFVWQLREHRLSLFQVLSEMEDEAKFDSDINSPFFWPRRYQKGSVIYMVLHKYTVKVVVKVTIFNLNVSYDQRFHLLCLKLSLFSCCISWLWEQHCPMSIAQHQLLVYESKK